MEAIKTIGETAEEAIEKVMDKIKEDAEKTVSVELEKTQPAMNRAQRRAAERRIGKKKRGQIDAVTETATKLNYINLIQELRKLNEKKENENYEDATEDD